MATATSSQQRRPTALPVAIADAPPSAAVSEWRLAYILAVGGERAEEALAAYRERGLTHDEMTDPDMKTYYARVDELLTAGEQVDEMSISLGVTDPQRRDTLDAVIARLRGMPYTQSDSEILIGRICEASALREAQTRAHHLNVLARRPDADLDAVIAEMRRAADDLQRRVARAAHLGAEAEPPAWAALVTTADELVRQQLPPIAWLVRNIIAEGLTLLVGKPKKGKSSLALNIALAMAGGGLALGGQIPVERCGVLYLALEDNERRMQARIRRMQGCDEAPRGLRLVYAWRRADEGGLDDLEALLDANPDIRLVILDTYAKMRPRRAHGANLYDDDYAALDCFHTLCQRRPGLALIILHHARKSGSDDPFDEVSGSLAINGVADNMLAMRRQGDTAELYRSGRDYDDDSALGLRGDAQTLVWKLDGSADDVRRSAQRTAILDALRADGEPMTPSEIAAALGKNRVTVQRLLSKMLEEPRPIIATDRGRYRLLTTPPDDDTGADDDAERPHHNGAHLSDASRDNAAA